MSGRTFLSLTAPAVVTFLVCCLLARFASLWWMVPVAALSVWLPYLFAAYFADSWAWWSHG